MIQSPTFERVAQEQFPEPDRLEFIAENIQRVMRVTYSRLFEGPGRLASGAIKLHLFDEKNSGKVARQKKRLREHIMQRNSTYWLAWDEDELIGLSKTSPFKPHPRVEEPAPSAYLNDVASVYEGFGVGSSLLERALSAFPPQMEASLDAFAFSSRANDIFAKLGYERAAVQPQDLGFEIGDLLVRQVHMVAPSVESVLNKLRAN